MSASAADELQWSWSLLSSAFLESKVQITRNDGETVIHEFPCTLADALEETEEEDEEAASIQVIFPDSHPDGLLAVTCIVGAHSMQISVINPDTDKPDEVFTRTGSYFASWEIHGGLLQIQYDHPCEHNCESRFETLTVNWPPRVLLSATEPGFEPFLSDMKAAVSRRDRSYIESQVAPGFYFARDHGGMFVEGESAAFNFNQVFILDNKRLLPEYQDAGWNKLAEMLAYDAFEIDEIGDLCAPYGATALKPWPESQLCFTRSADDRWQISGFVGGGD